MKKPGRILLTAKARLLADNETHKNVGLIFFLLQLFCVITLIWTAVAGQYLYVLLSIATILLLFVPWLVEAVFDIVISPPLKIIYMCCAVAGPVCGPIYKLYYLIPFWDTMLHTISGFLLAGIGFAIPEITDRNNNNSPNLILRMVLAFCFSMAAAVLWEFFEFSMDVIFHMDMQNDFVVNRITSYYLGTELGQTGVIENITNVTVNGTDLGLGGYLDIGLFDTMVDMIVNFVGAVVFCFASSNETVARVFIPLVNQVSQEETVENGITNSGQVI